MQPFARSRMAAFVFRPATHFCLMGLTRQSRGQHRPPAMSTYCTWLRQELVPACTITQHHRPASRQDGGPVPTACSA